MRQRAWSDDDWHVFGLVVYYTVVGIVTVAFVTEWWLNNGARLRELVGLPGH